MEVNPFFVEGVPLPWRKCLLSNCLLQETLLSWKHFQAHGGVIHFQETTVEVISKGQTLWKIARASRVAVAGMTERSRVPEAPKAFMTMVLVKPMHFYLLTMKRRMH